MIVKRAGKSLMELAIVMGLLSVVIGISTRTIIFLMKADGEGRAAVVSGTSFSRLANRFRKDAHSATKAELINGENNSPQRLQLTQVDGRVIEYRSDVGKVQVVVLQNDKTQGHEVYRLNGGVTRFELGKGKTPFVSLVYDTGSETSSGTAGAVRRHRTMRIDTLEGKDHRFSKQSP
jgi:hypothetical protein